MASLTLGWRTKLPSPWPTLILEMDLKISTNFNMLWIFRMDPRKTNGWNHAIMCGLGYVFFLFQGWKHQTNMFSFSGFWCPIHTLVFIFILILDPQIIEVISIPLGRWEVRNIIFKKVGLFFILFNSFSQATTFRHFIESTIWGRTSDGRNPQVACGCAGSWWLLLDSGHRENRGMLGGMIFETIISGMFSPKIDDILWYCHISWVTNVLFEDFFVYICWKQLHEKCHPPATCEPSRYLCSTLRWGPGVAYLDGCFIVAKVKV